MMHAPGGIIAELLKCTSLVAEELPPRLELSLTTSGPCRIIEVWVAPRSLHYHGKDLSRFLDGVLAPIARERPWRVGLLYTPCETGNSLRPAVRWLDETMGVVTKVGDLIIQHPRFIPIFENIRITNAVSRPRTFYLRHVVKAFPNEQALRLMLEQSSRHPASKPRP